MKSKVKINSEHLFELAALEINAISRVQYFFFCELSKFNIGTAYAIHKKVI